eukprot:SAG31_NODE_55_length_29938_cov_9.154027_16_plen_113_part_00
MMDTVTSMVDNGFRKILILNAHGGNGAGISVLLQKLMERYPDCEFYSRFAWGPSDQMNQIRKHHGRANRHRSKFPLTHFDLCSLVLWSSLCDAVQATWVTKDLDMQGRQKLL